MAKVTNPLLSFTASGSIARAITFTETRAGAIAKRWGKPTGTPSAAQAGQRQTYSQVMAYWSSLTPEQQQLQLDDRDNWLAIWEMDYPDSYARFISASPLAERSDWEIWVGFQLVDW